MRPIQAVRLGPSRAVLSLLTLCSITAASAIDHRQVVCSFTYTRHSLPDIRTASKRPYLLGGVYDREECVNCKRGGLWSTFCGFKPTSTVWDSQLCSAAQTAAVINRTLQQDDAELLQMTPCDLWKWLRGRTLWIVGDSITKDLYKALKCFMVEFHNLKTYHASNNYTAMHLLDEAQCVHMLENTRLCHIHAVQGDLFVKGNRTAVGVLPLLHESLALRHDIFILNFGLWHQETGQAHYQEHLQQLGQYFSSVQAKYPNMFFMETPKQHFGSDDGDYKDSWVAGRQGPWVCQPVRGVEMDAAGVLSAEPGDTVGQSVVAGGWRNVLAHQILENQYAMPILHIYNVTATAWEFHRRNSRGTECTHLCHPSIPQLWLWTMKQTFKQWRVSPVHNWKHSKPRNPGCATHLDRNEGGPGRPRPVQDVLRQQHHELGVWAWLLSHRKKPQIKNGVVVFQTSRDRGYSHRGTLKPWKQLQKLLAHSSKQHKGRQMQKLLQQPGHR